MCISLNMVLKLRRWSSAAVLLEVLACLAAHSFALEMEMPKFLQEPPKKLHFSNETGAQISCMASGHPTPRVTWQLLNGQQASAVPGLRQNMGNGTLFFPPFRGSEYRPEVHDATYRCRAENPFGAIVSRDVHVRAVVNQDYKPHVPRAHVLAGNTGVLTCIVPAAVQDHVKVTSWYMDDTIILPSIIDTGERVVMASYGRELHVRNARPEDYRAAFSCLVLDKLTGDRKRSDTSHLMVSEASGNIPPRLIIRPPTEFVVEKESDVDLSCVAHGNPPPTVSWYQEINGRPDHMGRTGDKGRLVIRSATPSDAGRWGCIAQSSQGEQTTITNLLVLNPLIISIEPEHLVINSGGRAIVNCTVRGVFDGEIEWLRQGHPVGIAGSGGGRIRRLPPNSLLISSMSRDDAGLYQCIVRKGLDSAQATARILLGDTSPELHYTFIEQALRPGSPVSLRCSANGTPPPRFSWYLDGQPLQEMLPTHRYNYGQYVERSDDVISHLNISIARSEDGGLYSCKAENSVGSVTHTARLNIYGQPYIRFIAPLRAVARNNITIYCPYSGYPISKVRWERQGTNFTNSLRHSEIEGGLRIYNVGPSDAGLYTCSVSSPAGELAKRDLQLNVLKPPQLAPFVFPTNVEEGSNIQATCSVMSGDRPIFFSWLKDNFPIPASLEVEQRSMEFFSLLIIKEVSSSHSGTYTCVASNNAAKSNFSAELVVRVAPQWIYEPHEISTLIGTPIKVHCSAKGFPLPQITWMKGQGQTNQNFQPIELFDSRLLTNGTLSIQSASPQDEGFYLCKATNNIGAGLSKTIFIGVNEPPRFEHGSKNISTKREDSVTLVCEVFGDNPIQIIWTHNMNRLDASNYRLIISEAKTESGMKSQLYIRQTDRQDSGLYKCQAENTFGRSELVIYLAVQERPDAPVGLEVIEVNSRMVKLGWRRPFDGNSPVSSYLVQYGLLQSANDWDAATTTNVTLPARTAFDRSLDINKMESKEQAIISGLQPATTYILRMLAINQIDHSSFTSSVIAKTLEEAPIDSPRNVQVQSSGPGELHVTWQAPPRDKWNGELLGFTIIWQENSPGTNSINNTKSASVSGWTTSKYTITGLNKFTRYSVSVKAFNSISHGPTSTPVTATTLEGVPEAPPEDVQCEAQSAQSIKISWRPPPLLYRGGIIQGYKVHYRPVLMNDNLEQWTSSEIKRTSGTDTQLHALRPHTTYVLQARAYTAAGDGTPSRPIHCTTDEDFPGQPNGIKALSLSADSILTSWLPPNKPNGLIKHYTIYVREAVRSSKHVSHIVQNNETSNHAIGTGEMLYIVKSLKEGHLYEFWITATTSTGEGEPSGIITQEPTAKSPARIASFGGPISAGSGSAVILGCRTAGTPNPRTRWMKAEAPVTHHHSLTITHYGDLYIPKIDAMLADNYTCAARNSGGEDSITYTIKVLLPPNPPTIHVLSPQDSHALKLKLEPPLNNQDTTPPQGYTLNFKRENEDWQTIDLSPDSTTFTLEDLKCGSTYHLYITAHNRVGEGNPSSIVIASTKGGAPKIPLENDFLSTNSSTLRMNMFTWEDHGCPIIQFVVEYKQLGSTHWIRIDNQHNVDTMFITDLIPATWYQLKVSASNEAGITLANYNFATTTINGARIAAPSNYPDDGIYSDENMTDSIVLLILCIVITIAAIIMAYLLLKKRRQDLRRDDKSEDDNCRNCQQVYSALPMKPNGKIIDDTSEMYEISPYATFSVGAGPQPSRSVTAATLDYTLQFRTFGHSENEGLNPPPPPPCVGYPNRPARFRQKQRCYHSNDEDSTISKAETVRLARGTGPGRRRPGGLAPSPPDTVDSDSEDSTNTDPRCSHRQRAARALHHADSEM